VHHAEHTRQDELEGVLPCADASRLERSEEMKKPAYFQAIPSLFPNALRASTVELTDLFGLADLLPAEPRYNIAPTQTVFAVRINPVGSRERALLRWGLIPMGQP
jgi:hypothetical protein